MEGVTSGRVLSVAAIILLHILLPATAAPVPATLSLPALQVNICYN